MSSYKKSVILALLVLSVSLTTTWTADTAPSAPSTSKPHPPCVWTWLCRSPCKPVLHGGRCTTKCRNVVIERKCVKACGDEGSASANSSAIAGASANQNQPNRCVTRCTTDHVRRCSRVCPAPSTVFKCRVACKHRCVRPRSTALKAVMHK